MYNLGKIRDSFRKNVLLIKKVTVLLLVDQQTFLAASAPSKPEQQPTTTKGHLLEKLNALMSYSVKLFSLLTAYNVLMQ